MDEIALTTDSIIRLEYKITLCIQKLNANTRSSLQNHRTHANYRVFASLLRAKIAARYHLFAASTSLRPRFVCSIKLSFCFGADGDRGDRHAKRNGIDREYGNFQRSKNIVNMVVGKPCSRRGTAQFVTVSITPVDPPLYTR